MPCPVEKLRACEGWKGMLWAKGDKNEAYDATEVCNWIQVLGKLCTSTYRIAFSQLSYFLLPAVSRASAGSVTRT